MVGAALMKQGWAQDGINERASEVQSAPCERTPVTKRVAVSWSVNFIADAKGSIVLS